MSFYMLTAECEDGAQKTEFKQMENDDYISYKKVPEIVVSPLHTWLSVLPSLPLSRCVEEPQ